MSGMALNTRFQVGIKGTSEERLSLLEKVVLTLVSLILHHDTALRLINKENNMCLKFMEANVITQCAIAAKDEYDEHRIPGKAHPSGKAFKDVAWALIWSLAKKVAETAGPELPDRDFILKCLDLFLAHGSEVDRFYPAMLKPCEKTEEEKKDSKEPQEPPAAQVWVIKLKRTNEGNQIHQALLSLEGDNHLSVLMDAKYTGDHAPKGSLARALEKVLPA